MLVVDQIEQVFTVDGVDEGERQVFAATLAALARDECCSVIVTMRSDFYVRLETLTALLEQQLKLPRFCARSAGIAYHAPSIKLKGTPPSNDSRSSLWPRLVG